MMSPPESPREWWTLEEYAISLFEQKKTGSDEFVLLVKIFGRPKLAEIWERYQKKNAKKHKVG